MLTVIFSNPRGPTHSMGPLSAIYLTGRELRETPNGAALATDANFRWHTPAGAFSRFDCDGRCQVELSRSSGESMRYGPYRSFSSLNGIKFTDHQLFCNYDESTKDWYGYESGQHWDVLRVTPA